MFPTTIDVVTADRSRRLEGYATRSRRRFRFAASPDTYIADSAAGSDSAARHQRESYRPALGR